MYNYYLLDVLYMYYIHCNIHTLYTSQIFFLFYHKKSFVKPLSIYIYVHIALLHICIHNNIAIYVYVYSCFYYIVLYYIIV